MIFNNKKIINFISDKRIESLFNISHIIARYKTAEYYNRIAFSEFKGKFTGKDVVIVAAGPSVNKFIPIKDAIYIGMNRSFLLKDVSFDFLFACDLLGISSFMDEFAEYEGNHCIKFIGEQSEGEGRDIPEQYFLSLKNARKYKTDSKLPVTIKIPVDIDILPIWNSNSVAHQAIQFALFTNPKTLYLVGCDCTGVKAGHFVEGKFDNKMINSFSDEFWKESNNCLLNGWNQIKQFAKIHYPNTKIISINPIGLKGIFNEDIYTYNGQYVKDIGNEN